MYRIDLPELGFAERWRDATRLLLSHDIAPDAIIWRFGGGGDLFACDPLPGEVGPRRATVSRPLNDLAGSVLCHQEAEVPALLYSAFHRHQSDRRAIANPADPLTRRLERLAKAVRRDIHKMHAFVRFRELPTETSRRRFGAWFEPEHRIVEAATPFFAKRFADMDWTIATPAGVARFENGALSFHPAAQRPDVPEDACESLWATYFQNIFNPARLHLKAMQSEMPKKYWKNMPETQLIPEMLAQADRRVAAMRAAQPASPPSRASGILKRLAEGAPGSVDSLEAAADAARVCRRCGLCEAATQTVWGRGDPSAPLMIVGEQPGDAEDLSGQPFVGPAGKVLTEAMGEVGTGPVWLTNAVKHFKFTPRGKRRLHQTPSRDEVLHCRWWLDLERKFVKPRLTVALGATAAFALTGNDAPLAPRRGTIERTPDGGQVLLTWHPSYVLRLTGESAAVARRSLKVDLSLARRLVAETSG
ncbi:DNA polymerase [Aliiruegeria haliotis]|uniref:Type-4 uracil-DNA glycosylase n=1 Tax=Aliiruegeria haliotis TaxID=1280846 RepID=A0A2T0RLT0_9RHOB|nr:UdgX family uracil-DNA binding protein [Aliiruegeria haliotis]PRY22144.1 DNA polymerase [Aliiruegeria haliotis]